MRSLKNIFVISMVIISLGSTSLAHEKSDSYQECVDDCNVALDAADEMIVTLEDVVKQNQALVTLLENKNVSLREALDDAQEDKYKWYKNPAITLTTGLLLGVITGVQIR